MSDEPKEVAEEKAQGGGFMKGLIFKLLQFVLVIALGVGGGIYSAQQKPEWFGLSKGQAAIQAEADALVSEVGKLIALPGDEKPTVATITDFEKLKDQVFFANAKNDDKVLIYTNAKKAILYRPSEKRVIEVGAVNINQQEQPAGSPVPTPTATPIAE